MKPASKKRVVGHLIYAYKLSERHACKLVGLSPTAYRYKPKQRDDERVTTRLKEFAGEYPRYGYLLLCGGPSTPLIAQWAGWFEAYKRLLFTEETVLKSPEIL